MKFLSTLSLLSLCFLLLSSQCKKEDMESNKAGLSYFDCAYYNYYPQDTFPSYTLEDSLKVVNYLLEKQYYTKEFIEQYKPIFYFLPRINGLLDTVLFDQYLNRVQGGYRSLNRLTILSLIHSEVVVIGKVLDIKQVKDMEGCLFYKTLYVVEVEKVLNARVAIKKGDLVLVGGITGYDGGCVPEAETVTVISHYRELEKGQKEIFLLGKSAYDISFLKREVARKYRKDVKLYDDEYCANMFRIRNEYEEEVSIINKEQIKDIELFFKNN